MQVIRSILLVLLATVALTAAAQVKQARGKATVTYSGWSASGEDKQRATQAAQLKAVEFYYAEAGQSESENFDAVRDKILADPDRYILETTVLAEQVDKEKKQVTTAVRVSLNVANLRNLVKSGSAVANAAPGQKSPLAFVFVSRQVDALKTYDARVYKRVDRSVTRSASNARSESGTEGESIAAGQIGTNASTSSSSSRQANLTRTRESGGSTTRRSSEATYRLYPSANLNQVFSSTFSRAGFAVKEAAFVEPLTGGQFKVANVEADYQSGNDLKSATLQSIASGMRMAQIPYVALGTLDIGAADTDPATGLMRVAVTVNAKIFDVSQAIPDTKASVGPVTYAGVGPSEDEARGSALKQAASSAAQELASQVTTQRMQ